MEVSTIIEEHEETVEVKNITVGLTELHHHNGCTHTSFENAVMLAEKGKSVCVIVTDKDTYASLVKFYGISHDVADEGFILKNIAVLPYSKLDEAKEIYNYIICDFGYMRPEHQK